MPHTARKPPEKTYVIHDSKGRELGEAAGPSKQAALVRLFRMDPEGQHIGPATAAKMMKDKAVRFTVVAWAVGGKASESRVKCEVRTCPRSFTPGKDGGAGRCARCYMRQHRGLPDVTAGDAARAEQRAAGELSPRSSRIVGYVRPELEELARGLVGKAGRGKPLAFDSMSDLVNFAVASLLGQEELL